MKILVVCSYKPQLPEGCVPFVREQVDALRARGCDCAYHHIKGKGMLGYLRELPKLRKAIKENNPDVIHAHFGLTGLIAGLATVGTRVPVVVTYHGCDINAKKLRPFSRVAMRLAARNIFVSKRQMINAYGSEVRAAKATKGCIMPCGINTKLFDANQVDHAWIDAKFTKVDKVLFAGGFSIDVKDPKLAMQTVEELRVKIEEVKDEGREIELIELRGYTREQVVTLMYKRKALLLTSIREGSPQVVKEAMACGCPIVSVDVGDVAERVTGVDGCYVVKSRESRELAAALERAIAYGRTKGREKLLADGLDNNQIAKRLIEIYNQVQ